MLIMLRAILQCFEYFKGVFHFKVYAHPKLKSQFLGLLLGDSSDKISLLVFLVLLHLTEEYQAFC